MGNKIITRNGVSIDLGIPAEITSFEATGTSSHVSRGKLKVFFIGKTGDIRVFNREFSEQLISSLPGTPVVAFYDEESEDFIGHNDEQYVYGYVPEDAIPEFVEEDGKTWAVVDVNLFTERQDKIGEIANKIIGKAQSLELNPDTVDWELVYINGKLERIVFKKGSFYGLSVLGDNQKPAFTGSSFFTTEALEAIRSFREQEKNDGGHQRMNKNEFLSLGISEKIKRLHEIIEEKHVFEDFYIVDFTEEKVIICNYTSNGSAYYAADFKWLNDDEYEVGDFNEVFPTYAEKEKNSSIPSGFEKQNDEEEKSLESCSPLPTDENQEGDQEASPNGGDNELQNESQSEESTSSNEDQGEDDQTSVVEQPSQSEADNQNESETSADGEQSGESEDGSNSGQGEDNGAVGNATLQDFDSSVERDSNENEPKENTEEDKEEKENATKKVAANASALSSEERDELDTLRREKKLSLINEYKGFLGEEVIKQLIEKVNDYDLISLENELKIKSFDANKQKLQEKGDSTRCVILPTVQKTHSDDINRLVAENLKR